MGESEYIWDEQKELYYKIDVVPDTSGAMTKQTTYYNPYTGEYSYETAPIGPAAGTNPAHPPKAMGPGTGTQSVGAGAAPTGPWVPPKKSKAFGFLCFVLFLASFAVTGYLLGLHEVLIQLFSK